MYMARMAALAEAAARLCQDSMCMRRHAKAFAAVAAVLLYTEPVSFAWLSGAALSEAGLAVALFLLLACRGVLEGTKHSNRCSMLEKHLHAIVSQQ